MSRQLEFSAVAGLYSQLTGVLAGFAFASIVALISVRLTASASSPNVSYAYSPLTGSFLALAMTSLNYAIVASDKSNSARTATLEITAGVGFGAAGLILTYSILVMLRAVELDAPDPSGIAARAVKLVEIVFTIGLCPLIILLMYGAVQDHIVARGIQAVGVDTIRALGLTAASCTCLSGLITYLLRGSISARLTQAYWLKPTFAGATIAISIISTATTSAIINYTSPTTVQSDVFPMFGILILWMLATYAQLTSVLD